MDSPSEVDVPSETFFFMFDTIPGCLLIQSSYDVVLLYLSRLRVWIG